MCHELDYYRKQIMLHFLARLLPLLEVANLMNTLRYVQADQTVHPQQRLWSFKLANELESMLYTPTPEELNLAIQAGNMEARTTFIQRHPPATTPSYMRVPF